MARQDQTFEAQSIHTPIGWLFGRVLEAFAAKEKRHYLFEVLAGRNTHVLEQWNSWILEFRSVLRNPDIAPDKAFEELSTSPPDRIGDFMAEVFAVINLSRDGYRDFQVVLAKGDRAEPDFTAAKDGQLVRIEVKHLREPQDVIRTVAMARWKNRCAEEPARFNFAMGLTHHHHASLSDAGIARLNNAIDQLPDAADRECRITLEPGVSVVLTKTVGKRGLAIRCGMGAKDFEPDLPELQNLFVKAFRGVSASLPKFYGRQMDPNALNVVAMQWETAKGMYDPATIEKVQESIEQAFAAVGLRLRILMFVQPPSHSRRFSVH